VSLAEEENPCQASKYKLNFTAIRGKQVVMVFYLWMSLCLKETWKMC